MCADTITTHFDTWNKGLLAAGLNVNLQRGVTKERCIVELKQAAQGLGHAPTPKEFRKYASMSSNTVTRLFGSWDKGLLAAGLKVRKHLTKSEGISLLRRVARKLKRTPTHAEFDKYAMMSYGIIVTLFGSWNNALKAAGLNVRVWRDATKSEGIKELKRVARKLGKTPTAFDFSEHARMSYATITKLFGSWNAGVMAAGLKITVQYGRTKSGCIKELKQVAKKIGRTPTVHEFDKQSDISISVIIKRFGSWGKGVLAAGLNINRNRGVK